MFRKLQSVFILLFGLILLTSCSSETRRYQLHQDDRTQVTYSEVRKNINVTGKTLKQDISNRLDVLQIFIDDLMKEYRTAGEERRQLLKPKVQKLESLMSRVRGSIKTYSPEGEQLTEKQRREIIDRMQQLRATYHDLVQRLGITWH